MYVQSNLKKILDERDISIRQLAKDAGVAFESVRRIYNNEATQFQFQTVGAICKALDIELSELLYLEDGDSKKED